MNIEKKMKPELRSAPGASEANVAGAVDEHAPRKPTLAENVIVTIKVLVGFGLFGAALWGIDLWITAR
jgi:hypothetical protein